MQTITSAASLDMLAMVGIFIFRGGVNLLKVAAAARMCRLANEQLYPEGKLVGRR